MIQAQNIVIVYLSTISINYLDQNLKVQLD